MNQTILALGQVPEMATARHRLPLPVSGALQPTGPPPAPKMEGDGWLVRRGQALKANP